MYSIEQTNIGQADVLHAESHIETQELKVDIDQNERALVDVILVS